jgi:uncharacterized membrane protein
LYLNNENNNKGEKNMKTTTHENTAQTLGMVQVALFAALIIILAFTPFLGYIPLGFTRATIIHIPVIIGSLMLGPKKGAFLGFVFGMTSFINNTMNPTATSFVFTPFFELGEVHGGIGSVIICFVPRILVGVVPWYVYRGLERIFGKQMLSLAAAGIAGALTNTLLVMNLIYVFFRTAYAAANNVAEGAVYTFILSIIGMNGVPEAVVSAVLVSIICRVLFQYRQTQ